MTVNAQNKDPIGADNLSSVRRSGFEGESRYFGEMVVASPSNLKNNVGGS